MSVRRVPSDPGATEEVPLEVPDADAAEQHADVVDVTETDAAAEDAERVVAVDDDEYR